MILSLKYGTLDNQTCEALLKYPPLWIHVEDPFAEIKEDARKAESKHILNLIYEFMRFALKQWVIEYGAIVRAQPRLKSYLAQRGTVDKLRSYLLEANDKIPDYVDSWCPDKCSFIKQLPDIPMGGSKT